MGCRRPGVNASERSPARISTTRRSKCSRRYRLTIDVRAKSLTAVRRIFGVSGHGIADWLSSMFYPANLAILTHIAHMNDVSGRGDPKRRYCVWLREDAFVIHFATGFDQHLISSVITGSIPGDRRASRLLPSSDLLQTESMKLIPVRWLP